MNVENEMEKIVTKIEEWLALQPTSKRRIELDDIEHGLKNRVNNSMTVHNIVVEVAEQLVEPYRCDEALLQEAQTELSHYLDMGYTTKEAIHYRDKGGSNNSILNAMLHEMWRIEYAQRDYHRWQQDVDETEAKLWKSVEQRIDDAVRKVSSERYNRLRH